ncbi:MAG: hypothetical protein PHX61_03070 [Alphaproteobacteria bacterium]|nr:hypothetical protein [Alphaproteobacteria bacterium]
MVVGTSSEKIRKFLSVDIYDLLFFAALGVLLSPLHKVGLIAALCGYSCLLYLLVFFINNIKFFLKNILINQNYKNKVWAFLGGLNFLILMAVFFFYVVSGSSFKFEQLLNIGNTKTIIFYLWGLVTILFLIIKEKISTKI